jgi:hypothetical protein
MRIVAGREGGRMSDDAINPMQSALAAPRCTARSKRTGLPCHAPAVRGCEVCRMHGAGGGAPAGRRNGRYRSGLYTQKTIELQQQVALLTREARIVCEVIE